MKFIYVFIDGIGFGKAGKYNPFSLYPSEIFSHLSLSKPVLSTWASKQEQTKPFSTEYQYSGERFCIKAIDPSSNIKGLPQSGTGQTSLFTGVDGPLVLARHDANFPSFTLKKFIKKFSIIKALNEKNIPATLINSYSPFYFKSIFPRTRFLSASTLTQIAAAIPLQDFYTLSRNESLYMDITHEFLIDQFQSPDAKYRQGNWEGFSIDALLHKQDASRQGKRLVELSRKYNLTLFEYFLTDKLGHSQDIKSSELIVNTLNKFLNSAIDELRKNETLIVSSDHGNFEEMNHKQHTHNAVPLIVAGEKKDILIDNVNKLADIPRTILDLFEIDTSELIHAHKLQL